MITATPESLTQKTEAEFREWLRRPQIETLRRVVAAKQKTEACLALRDAKQASAANYKLESANTHLLLAQRYEDFLDVLREIEEQPITTPYTTVKLS